jgi:uncharacterized membrane protein
MVTLEKSNFKKLPNRNPDSAPIQPATITSVTTFSGPIPPPEFLKQYDLLVPGIAKRFLEEPHLEAEHRRNLEKTMLSERIRMSKRGQWMAFCLALLSILAAFTAIFTGYSIAGLAIFFTAAASLVGVFFYAKKQQS